MKIRKRFILVILLVALAALFLRTEQGFSGVGQVDVDFHGVLQSTGIIRDTNGFQYGLLDSNEWVQLRTQLKFDLDIMPKYTGDPDVVLRRVFLSYRGAYDAIFDLEDRYREVPDSRRGGGSRYDLGLDDVKSENDLREAFVDFTARVGDGTLNARLGRQITQWGEADIFNLINIINPADYRGFGAFANPDELANPIWMSRFDHNTGPMGFFDNVSSQLLVIPDNRPAIHGPASATATGPYSIYIPGIDVRQNDNASGFKDMQYGFRLGLVKDYLATYFYAFTGFQALPAVNMSQYGAGTVTLDHPRYKMFGFSFNYNSEQVLKGVVRGEFAYMNELSYGDAGPSGGAEGYSLHSTYQAMIGFDKTLHPGSWLGTDSAAPASLQLFYKRVADWEYSKTAQYGAKQDAIRITFNAQTDYMHGSVVPGFAVAYDFEDVWLIAPYIDYTPDGKWFFHLASTMFFGDREAITDLVTAIDTTEVVFRVGYRW